MNDKLHPAAAEDLSSLSALERVRHATAGKGDERKNTLDDESRVKILSPGMMVFKRFVRNKLAITGTVILVLMALFSFVAALFSPYSQTQIFTRVEATPQLYATVAYNRDLKAFTADGSPMSATLRAKFAFARSRRQDSFKDGPVTYSITALDSGSYLVGKDELFFSYNPMEGLTFPEGASDEFKAALEKADQEGLEGFSADGRLFTLQKGKAQADVLVKEPLALMSHYELNADEGFEEFDRNLAFRAAAEMAMKNGESDFSFGEDTYHLEEVLPDAVIKVSRGDQVIGLLTPWQVVPKNRNVKVPVDLAVKLIGAAVNHETSVVYKAPEGADGKAADREVTYRVTRGNYDYSVTAPVMKEMIAVYDPPSGKHWLGTDEKGMDLLTRLMYGGRISLMVGFVVIGIELLIGVVFGGVSGYFGGWIDLLCMRFIDLFNSIPYFPVMIITGAVMDKMNVPSTQRIFLLMMIMGLMGWTGVARIVRGQILSLREQDFMVAAEATGLSVRKRIFRHLVPNVMPLLIVQATMGLGGIIITEATLSFLGLGVKPPLASWGSIINAANNQYVMQNCWWIWLPTGFLIVLTVLGFNFVGDGLRDAYDPKMKR